MGGPPSATLLEAPLSPDEALASVLDASVAYLRNALDRLKLIAREVDLLILRCWPGSPKLKHLLRCTPVAAAHD